MKINTSQSEKIRPRLSIGPILYHWSREAVFSFYDSIAQAPVDIVYLGETVCSKRRVVRPDDWLEIAEFQRIIE